MGQRIRHIEDDLKGFFYGCFVTKTMASGDSVLFFISRGIQLSLLFIVGIHVKQ